MAVSYCRPTAGLWRIRQAQDRLSGEGREQPPSDRFGKGYDLDADVKETIDGYMVSVEAPGIEQKDINLTVQENVLLVRVVKKCGADEKPHSYFVRERRFGGFERAFMLPAHVQADKVTAQYRNGVLSVFLPKIEEAKPRNIDIKVD